MLPPGPRAPRLLQTAWWAQDPIGLFDRCAERYGDTFTINLGYRGRVVCISSPEGVKSVFRGEPTVFHAGDAYEVLGPVAGRRSLLLLDEDEHLAMRRLLLPPLHGKALEHWRGLIEQIIDEAIASWPRDRPFALRPRMEKVTLDVIMRIVFGIRDPARADELRQLLPFMFEIGHLVGISFLYPKLQKDLGPRSPWGQFVRRRARIDELLYSEITARRAELAETAPDSGHSDVLSLLLGARREDGEPMSDVELRDSLITMLLAGQETTATSLAWAFERLLRHPRERAALEADLATGSQDYLDAVIKETLRVRPVVAQVGRVVTTPTEVGGWVIPEGRMLMGVISRIHRSPALYRDPLRFRPERFGEGEGEGYTWLPFGGGVRRCIGAGLASLEMRTVISTIFASVRLVAPDRSDEKAVVRGVTLVPAKGGQVAIAGLAG